MKQDCSEAVQAAMSRLFDRAAIPPEKLPQSSSSFFYSNIAVLGMTRERAAAMLRETAERLEHQG